MGRMIVFRVVDNRMQFKCTACGAKRNLPVQANLRSKSVRCHKCGSSTRCSLNRRIGPREQHSGKATMLTTDHKEIAVLVHDISLNGGVGLDVPIRTARAGTVKIGDEVRFNCKWYPRLLGSGRFVVINNKGQRIGIKKV